MEDKMVNNEKTKQKYGYEISSLAPTSNLPVLWSCDECGEEREYSYAYCLKKTKKAESQGTKELCQKCSHAHRKGKVTTKKKAGDAWLPLPPEVDVAATQERYGYDPRDLSPWSRKRVVVRCFETGVICSPRRCGLNRYKSIIETGHFISGGAWTAKRRKGIKVSSTTKQAMSKSQKNRRVREKTITPPASSPNPTVSPNDSWKLSK
jgi:hypothetical protein